MRVNISSGTTILELPCERNLISADDDVRRDGGLLRVDFGTRCGFVCEA